MPGGGVIGCRLFQPDDEDIAVVSLFRATVGGLELAAQFSVAKNGRVQVDVIDKTAQPYIDDLREHGLWSQKLGHNVHMDEGRDFLEAVVDSLRNSSYWHTSVEIPTPTDQPILASTSQ